MQEYQIPAYATGVACSVAIFWSKLAHEPNPEDNAEEKQDLKTVEDGQLALF